MSDVHVLCALAARRFAILLHENGALVAALTENVFADPAFLGFHEMSGP